MGIADNDRRLTSDIDEIAPDGSQVRVLGSVCRGSMGHFTILKGQTIRATCHQTVDEIWFVLAGKGEMWRKSADQTLTVEISAGDSLCIPVGTAFQVRNTGIADLTVLGQTMPPWPGNDEAIYVDGPWQAS